MTFAQPGFFGEQSHSHQKRTQKRKLTIFENTKQVIQDYDTVFDNSIPLRKNDLLRITYFRIPGVPGLHFVPWHRGSWCLGAAAPVTGAAADEYNLNVVDCNASVTVARPAVLPNCQCSACSGRSRGGELRRPLLRGAARSMRLKMPKPSWLPRGRASASSSSM